MDIKILKEKIQKLSDENLKLIQELKEKCWNVERKKEKTIIEKGTIDIDFSDKKIKKKQIPNDFNLQYRQWYATCKSILESNKDKESLKEFIEEHNLLQKNTKKMFISQYEQLPIIDILLRQINIIKSIPNYIEGKAYNFKLSLASTLLGDELEESRHLLKNGFYRAAGAIAGVVLERHIKINFNQSIPIIKYKEKATLGYLIKIAEDKAIFENPMIQKLKYLNQIRIKCDHDKKTTPTENEIIDLIENTNKLIHNID